MRRLVALLLFLAFVEDGGAAYKSHLGAPMGWVFFALLDASFLKVRPFDLIMLLILLVAATKRPKPLPVTAPMKSALLLVLATEVLWFCYGVATGGDARTATWQTYRVLSTVLVAFTVAATHRTIVDFYRLGKWLLAAAIYRGVMCWISYFTWARDVIGGVGTYLTTHDDTICWVVAIFLLIIDSVGRRSPMVTARNAALALFFIGAIQWNSRRLAWVSLLMGLVVVYVLFPKGAAKRRINGFVRLAVPALLIYVAVGWGRQERIFLPLRSLSTISTQEDSSTLARNAENLSLILTANSFHSAIGTGWGKPYIPITTKYDISAAFELWQYVPHNSILGLLAFTGILGFAGFWLAIPTSVFLNARVARLSEDPKARAIGIVGVAQLVVCANQLYADMGIFDVKPMYAIAVSYAIALRLPAVADVWGAPTGPRPA